MPFPATHLIISNRLLRAGLRRKVKSPPDFFLGSIAPDAVHFREGFCGDFKKISHLTIGSENWGALTNNKEWAENVLDFLKSRQENHDFWLGYCVHILADIQNNINIWQPFRKRSAVDSANIWGSDYHKDSYFLDFEAWVTEKDRAYIEEQLALSVSRDCYKIVSKTELDSIKDNILNKQYIKTPDFSGKTLFMSYDDFHGFIDKTAANIEDFLETGDNITFGG